MFGEGTAASILCNGNIDGSACTLTTCGRALEHSPLNSSKHYKTGGIAYFDNFSSARKFLVHATVFMSVELRITEACCVTHYLVFRCSLNKIFVRIDPLVGFGVNLAYSFGLSCLHHDLRFPRIKIWMDGWGLYECKFFGRYSSI